MSAIIEGIMLKDSVELEELTDQLIEKTKRSVCKFKVSEIVTKDTIDEEGI